MRILLLIVIAFICIGSVSAQEMVTVPKSQIIKAAETIQDQRDTIVTLERINAELDYQVQLQGSIIRVDSAQIALLTRRAEIADGIIDRYENHIEKENRWYNKPWVHFVGGFTAALVTTVMVKNLSD